MKQQAATKTERTKERERAKQPIHIISFRDRPQSASNWKFTDFYRFLHTYTHAKPTTKKNYFITTIIRTRNTKLHISWGTNWSLIYIKFLPQKLEIYRYKLEGEKAEKIEGKCRAREREVLFARRECLRMRELSENQRERCRWGNERIANTHIHNRSPAIQIYDVVLCLFSYSYYWNSLFLLWISFYCLHTFFWEGESERKSEKKLTFSINQRYSATIHRKKKTQTPPANANSQIHPPLKFYKYIVAVRTLLTLF